MCTSKVLRMYMCELPHTYLAMSFGVVPCPFVAIACPYRLPPPTPYLLSQSASSEFSFWFFPISIATAYVCVCVSVCDRECV